ncbi:piezo-type mechanosensitive ion channel component, partial [Thalictrum thalictroides]
DTEIWQTIGFWHYHIPGLYLLAQFCLGILVALGNLVNNSVFLYQSNQDGLSSGDKIVEGKEVHIRDMAKRNASLAWLLICFLLRPFR